MNVSAKVINSLNTAPDVKYTAWIEGDISKDEIKELKEHTNKVAEIQNTLRVAVDVKFSCKAP